MKISLIIPSLHQGGMERVMSELANYWIANGLEVNYIFLVKHDPFYRINEGIGVDYPPFEYEDNAFSKLLYAVKLRSWLRKNIRKTKPDTALSFGDNYNPFVIWSLKGLNIKVFISKRRNPTIRGSFWRNLVERWLIPQATGLIAQTIYAKEYFEKYFGINTIRVIPNPVVIIPRDEKIEKENIIVSVGRLVPEKNFHKLLELFSSSSYSNWKLVIVGDGVLRNSIKLKIDELALGNRVILWGKTKDLSEVLSKSRIFAFTSRSEGYPNALCEAMAFPLPVISFDCIAGPGEIIKNGHNGFLVEMGNDDEFVQRLNELMESDSLREQLARNAEEIRLENSISKISNMYLEYFNNN